MNTDEKYMLRCLELALLGAGTTAPNPMVGCVIVFADQIIGEGFTSPYGGNHAEVNAINSVKDRSLLSRSTIYVSLEPCAHHGKTPPCADLIVRERIPRVVIACLDPFAKVNGMGIKRLIESGAEVKLGVLENEAIELNKRFMTFHQQKRPYIILKWAETSDGFVDNIRSTRADGALRITSNASNMLVHKWRSEEAAIMVGKNTALLDDPSLTTRNYNGQNPLRILIDSELETPSSANIFSDGAKTLVISKNERVGSHFETIKVADTRDLTSVLHQLYLRNILSVIVEGGPELHRSFYLAGLWDEVRRLVSPLKIGNGIAALKIEEHEEGALMVGADRLLIYRKP